MVCYLYEFNICDNNRVLVGMSLYYKPILQIDSNAFGIRFTASQSLIIQPFVLHHALKPLIKFQLIHCFNERSFHLRLKYI